MKDTDKVKMILNIGGEHLTLVSDFNRQDAIRDAEKIASGKFKEFRQQYPERSDREILAMVAYQMAYFYNEVRNSLEESTKMADELDAELEVLLRDNSTAE